MDTSRYPGIGRGTDPKVVAAMIAIAVATGCGAEKSDPRAADPLASAEGARPSPALRLLAPLSTSNATTRRPLFRWSTNGRATLELCADRACSQSLARIESNESSARPAAPLPAGVVFWRVSRANDGQGPSTAVWEVNIPARDTDQVGSWGAIPDFNGDGLGDIAVGVKLAAGQVRVFPGNASGVFTAPAQTLTGGSGFGDELGPAGDLDGDGFGDLAVWTSGPPQTVTVYRGGPQGLHDPVTFAAPAADPLSQARVVSAGDVNGDGYGDLIVGGQLAALHLGGAGGISTTAAQSLTNVPSGGCGPMPAPDARSPIAGGDFNGDGFPDAVITGQQGGLLYYGDGQGLVAQSKTYFGYGGLVGDYNGDGLVDTATYEIDVGSLTGTPTYFESQAGAYAYAGVGDTNGDGFSDVLYNISSLWGVPEAERLFFGTTTACLQTPCDRAVALYVPGHMNDGSGYAAVVAGGVGDVNGDGFADLAFGSPGAGALYLYLGSEAGPSYAPAVTITAEQGFGFGLARL